MYNCGCDDCKEKKAELNLSIGDSFKQLLNVGAAAFKRLQEIGSYKPQDLKTEKAYQNLINKTFDVFNFAISDNDMPNDMRRALQSDVFLFGGLKTHAQLFEASKLLLDDKGNLKSFKQLSNDFEKLNSSYNKTYLEAEYEFAVSSSQMAAKWSEFSDNDRYYLQYRTAGDTRVRQEHEALHTTTLPKDDPFWSSYTPPNGWNCRCTVVEVLKDKYPVSDSAEKIAKGELATTQLGKDGKNRLEIFRFNPGADKKLFPPKHPNNLIAGAKAASPIIKELFNNDVNRYSGITFKKEVGIKNGGSLEIFTTGKQNKQEFAKNKKALNIVANSGDKYRMLPIVNDGKPNPDAFNIKTNRLVDIKVSDGTNGKNIIQGAMKETSKQGAQELLLHITKKPNSYKEMYSALRMTVEKNRNKVVETITVIFPDNTVKKYDIERIRQKIRKR